jgi:hypothetical protein
LSGLFVADWLELAPAPGIVAASVILFIASQLLRPLLGRQLAEA